MKEIDTLWADLQAGLGALDKEKNTIKRLQLAKEATLQVIGRLQELFGLRSGFAGESAALVNYNRNLAPPFYARFIYFSNIAAFECLKKDQGPSETEELIRDELAGIRRFFQQHAEFRRYYLSEKTDLDALIFQNHPPDIIQLDELVVGISPDVNKGCLLVAYMKAFDDYAEYLTTAMKKEQAEPAIDTDFTWDGLVSDLNEVVIALEGDIKKAGRKATLKELQRAFGNFLHVNLTNGSQIDSNRRNNLHDAPSYLEKLAGKMIKRKDNLADNQNSRKRRG